MKSNASAIEAAGDEETLHTTAEASNNNNNATRTPSAMSTRSRAVSRPNSAFVEEATAHQTPNQRTNLPLGEFTPSRSTSAGKSTRLPGVLLASGNRKNDPNDANSPNNNNHSSKKTSTGTGTSSQPEQADTTKGHSLAVRQLLDAAAEESAKGAAARVSDRHAEVAARRLAELERKMEARLNDHLRSETVRNSAQRTKLNKDSYELVTRWRTLVTVASLSRACIAAWRREKQKQLISEFLAIKCADWMRRRKTRRVREEAMRNLERQLPPKPTPVALQQASAFFNRVPVEFVRRMLDEVAVPLCALAGMPLAVDDAPGTTAHFVMSGTVEIRARRTPANAVGSVNANAAAAARARMEAEEAAAAAAAAAEQKGEFSGGGKNANGGGGAGGNVVHRGRFRRRVPGGKATTATAASPTATTAATGNKRSVSGTGTLSGSSANAGNGNEQGASSSSHANNAAGTAAASSTAAGNNASQASSSAPGSRINNQQLAASSGVVIAPHNYNVLPSRELFQQHQTALDEARAEEAKQQAILAQQEQEEERRMHNRSKGNTTAKSSRRGSVGGAAAAVTAAVSLTSTLSMSSGLDASRDSIKHDSAAEQEQQNSNRNNNSNTISTVRVPVSYPAELSGPVFLFESLLFAPETYDVAVFATTDVLGYSLNVVRFHEFLQREAARVGVPANHIHANLAPAVIGSGMLGPIAGRNAQTASNAIGSSDPSSLGCGGNGTNNNGGVGGVNNNDEISGSSGGTGTVVGSPVGQLKQQREKQDTRTAVDTVARLMDERRSAVIELRHRLTPRFVCRSSPLLELWSAAGIAAVVQRCRCKIYRKHDVVVPPGSFGSLILFVVAGRLEVTHYAKATILGDALPTQGSNDATTSNNNNTNNTNNNSSKTVVVVRGKRIQLGQATSTETFREGQCVGELAALLKRKDKVLSSLSSVRALSNCDVWALSGADLRDLSCHQHAFSSAGRHDDDGRCEFGNIRSNSGRSGSRQQHQRECDSRYKW